MSKWEYLCVLTPVVIYLVIAIPAAIEHHRWVKYCQNHLRTRRGRDKGVDDWCWDKLHEGQG